MSESGAGIEMLGLRRAVAQLHRDEMHVPAGTRLALWRARNRALQVYKHRQRPRRPFPFLLRRAVAAALVLAVMAPVAFHVSPLSDPPADRTLATQMCEHCGQFEQACYL